MSCASVLAVTLAAVLAAAALLALGYAAARTLLLVVNVTGDAMLPALRPGRRLLVLRTPPGRPRAGAVVVFRLPRAEPVAETALPKPLLVKRLTARAGDAVPPAVLATVGARPGDLVPEGSVVLLGDNARVGSDSRHWGYVPQAAVVGVVIGRLGLDVRAASGRTRGAGRA